MANNINNNMRFNNYINDITTRIDDHIKDNTLNEIKQLLIEMSLEDAIEFATQMHKGQIRKGDKKPYVVHPQAVYSILKSFNVKDKVILVSAWLHDTIEDTKATYNIIKRKFNKEVANLVKALSSDPKEIAKIGKEEYLLKKMIQMSNNELTVKLADRLHNVTDIMSNPKAENIYIQTIYIIDGLREKRNLKQIHKKLIKAIERYLNKYRPINEALKLKRSGDRYKAQIGRINIEVYRAHGTRSSGYWSSTITIGKYGDNDYEEEYIQAQTKKELVKSIEAYIKDK